MLNSDSVTTLGIVAHEAAHAVQHSEGYSFMRLRASLARPVGTLSQLSPLVFIGGMLLGITTLMALGSVMLAGHACFCSCDAAGGAQCQHPCTVDA